MNIEEIKNTLREFQAQNGQKFKNTQAELKKVVSYKKKSVFRIEGRLDEMIMLKLVESHCIPILTYGMEVSYFIDRQERSKIRAAYNSVFRRIFGYRNFESVTQLQLALARPTWEMLIENRTVNFYNRLSTCSADSPVHIFSVL